MNKSVWIVYFTAVEDDAEHAYVGGMFTSEEAAYERATQLTNESLYPKIVCAPLDAMMCMRVS